MVEGKSGVVTAIATDDLDENHYLVIQYYYGFEATEEETEEERNGWVIAEFGGENAHIEVAMYVEETMPNIDGVFLTEFDDEEASSGYKM